MIDDMTRDYQVYSRSLMDIHTGDRGSDIDLNTEDVEMAVSQRAHLRCSVSSFRQLGEVFATRDGNFR